MNKAKIKTYAPQARKDFIAAVTARAHLLGLSEKAGKLEVVDSHLRGDITVISGKAWPLKVHGQRQQLISRIKKEGFVQTLEAVAYTWFNRFAALRYMELHDYLDHGHRALSSLDGTLPDILTHAIELAKSGELPGLKAGLVAEMKLAGNRDGELYRMLLVAQCNALSNVMPFLFERIDDETELLLPDNLLRTDSVISRLIASIEEDDWKDVEIIGWLYQYYISDKKEQVIGRVVKSEDIPAATQLFTPNWIVQYLVQNSIGRLWLMANPSSSLAAQWPYYIPPAEQMPQVQTQLDNLVQLRMDEDGGSINPETMSLLDPACGSGHILVEAYDVFKVIYLERGYQPRLIPRLILERNLYGLDIDDRAAQMAGFALLMKARADDRRLLEKPVNLNVLSLKESKALDVDELTSALESEMGGVGSKIDEEDWHYGHSDHILLQFKDEKSSTINLGADEIRAAIAALIATFENAKTFGSLIQISPVLERNLKMLAEYLQNALTKGDLYARAAAQDLLPLVAQATMLNNVYDAVVANPPYMGGKGMNSELKDFSKRVYPDSKTDLFAMFIERGFSWCKATGFNSMVTMQSWMFLASFQTMRESFISNFGLASLVQMPYDGRGPTAMGISFGISAFVFQKFRVPNFQSAFDCFRYFELTDDGRPKEFPSRNERNVFAAPDDFRKIPGSPIAYWATVNSIRAFDNKKIGEIAETRLGMATADNNKFLRYWFEVNHLHLGLTVNSRSEARASKKKWFLYQKGGEYRKWYGNVDYVVNWESDGFDIQNFSDETTGKIRSHNYNLDFIFREGVTWNALSSIDTSARISRNSLFDNAGSSLFVDDSDSRLKILAFLNSKVIVDLIKIISPTLNYQPGDIAKLPTCFSGHGTEKIPANTEKLIEIAERDWNYFETSWGFQDLFFCTLGAQGNRLQDCWENWADSASRHVVNAKSLEEENNAIFINGYGLSSELTADVQESKITLARADREKDCQRLISYAVGCMMGRFSLKEPGVIYASAGNIDFDENRYDGFPADLDGIVPLTDEIWFEDEAASRVREFLIAVWGVETLGDNMTWLAESLGAQASETPDETIRRYLADKFYKDHLQAYKKRPIYWLFSSGKHGAFQALVYLHRYHEGTLARMRAEYVVPLTGKIQSRIEMLTKDAIAAPSSAARNKLSKAVEKLKKKHVELLAYDEQLRHHADKRIQLNLDDGVRVNYGKFGNLLAEVKAVTGGAIDD